MTDAPRDSTPPPDPPPGEQARAIDLLESTYAELRRLAASYLESERSDHTLQPTALVHEAWCRLAGRGDSAMTREHFVATAARVMRHVLVDHARTRHALKRGGGRLGVSVDALAIEAPECEIDILALDDALRRLRELSDVQATLVELRFFGGLSLDEAAALSGVAARTADREWACAKAWLHDALRASDGVRRAGT